MARRRAAPFSQFADVVAAPDGAPNAGCSVLYVDVLPMDGGSPGVLVAM